MKKIILSNLLIFFFIFCIIEFASYLFIKIDTKDSIDNHNKTSKRQLTIRYAPIVNAEQEYENHRKIDYGDKNKPSILFFGCSYIYGWYVDENETISYLVTKYTGRTTVNRGVPGGCIMNMFDDINSSDFLTQAKSLPKPDYIIYLWINDHINRISRFYESPCIRENENFYELYPEWS